MLNVKEAFESIMKVNDNGTPLKSTCLHATNLTLLPLQKKIHDQNVEKGWWDSPRSFSTLTNLNISEVSEAVEADRKNLMDDNLTHHKGVPVECADACIRTMDVLDWLDNCDFTPSPHIINLIRGNKDDNDFLLALSSYCFTKAWESNICHDDDLTYCKGHLVDALYVLFQVIVNYDHNPVELMLEKMEFNATRPDHMRENRQGLPGQKRY